MGTRQCIGVFGKPSKSAAWVGTQSKSLTSIDFVAHSNAPRLYSLLHGDCKPGSTIMTPGHQESPIGPQLVNLTQGSIKITHGTGVMSFWQNRPRMHEIL